MRIKRLFSAICMITVLLSAIFNYKLNVSAQTNATNLIYSFVHCVNEEDVDNYIDLFPQGEKDEMREFIKYLKDILYQLIICQKRLIYFK